MFFFPRLPLGSVPQSLPETILLKLTFLCHQIEKFKKNCCGSSTLVILEPLATLKFSTGCLHEANHLVVLEWNSFKFPSARTAGTQLGLFILNPSRQRNRPCLLSTET